MEMAYTASKRGTCGRLSVGTIIARDSRPISLGYVGAPSGHMHCQEAKCNLTEPCTRTKHAERNAIDFAIENKIDIVGADIFSTDSPCLPCAELIVSHRLSRVYYDREYRVPDGLDYLWGHGVEVYQVLANGFCTKMT